MHQDRIDYLLSQLEACSDADRPTLIAHLQQFEQQMTEAQTQQLAAHCAWNPEGFLGGTARRID